MKTTSRTNKILAAAVTGMAIASANGAFAASEQTVSGPARPIYSAWKPRRPAPHPRLPASRLRPPDTPRARAPTTNGRWMGRLGGPVCLG